MLATGITFLLLGGGLAAAAWYVVRWIQGISATSASLQLRDAALRTQSTRVDAMEKAEAAQRAARLKEVAIDADAATSPDDVAALLRDVTGADDPKVN